MILKAVLYSIALAAIALLAAGMILYYVGLDIVNAELETMGD